MSAAGLIRKQLVDKNGVITHRNVRPDTTSETGAKRLDKLAADKEYADLPEPGRARAELDREDFVEHKYATSGKLRFSLAPEGYSGAFCEECQSFFTDDELQPNKVGEITCQVCGEPSYTDYLESGIRYEDRKYLNTERVRENTWYHITVRENWDEDILEPDFESQPIVHVGSFMASQMRMQAINDSAAFFNKIATKSLNKEERNGQNREVKYYCFEVAVKDDAPISSVVQYDDNTDVPQSLSADNADEFTARGYQMDGVTAYVNKHEAQGSVSLAVHPSAIRIVDRFEIAPS